MPINPELRPLYPPDWPEISKRIRFERAGGRCEGCGRVNGEMVPGYRPGRITVVVLACCHIEHDPRRSSDDDLASWCQRCHLQHDAPHHLARRILTMRARLAIGDLFAGPYQR